MSARHEAPALRPAQVGALATGHVAGMIDLAALPVWVGVALIGRYGMTPQAAGGMVTAYLISVVVASVALGPRTPGFDARRGACSGFAIALAAFAALGWVNGLGAMLALHVLAGLGAGAGLTFVHAAIGRTANPHRVFAVAQSGLGVSAIVFMGIGPALIARHGGAMLFVLFALIMGCAVAANAAAHPPTAARAAEAATAPLPPAARWVMLGITLMGLVQAGLFSFVERIGVDRGHGEQVPLLLVAVGVVNLLPAPLAALLQRRLRAETVALAGPLAQAALALVIVSASSLAAYALATPLFIAVMVFTHTFLFGWLARLDPSGRAVALTPAVLMSGAAAGPLLAGVLVQQAGYAALGAVLAGFSIMALLGFAHTRRLARGLPDRKDHPCKRKSSSPAR